MLRNRLHLVQEHQPARVLVRPHHGDVPCSMIDALILLAILVVLIGLVIITGKIGREGR